MIVYATGRLDVYTIRSSWYSRTREGNIGHGWDDHQCLVRPCKLTRQKLTRMKLTSVTSWSLAESNFTASSIPRLLQLRSRTTASTAFA
jgi:hypothetical protein